MQTKPLIHCADNKGIMIKLMLCVIAVLSLAMFIPTEAYAYGDCTNCTCAPGSPGRHPASGDWDARNECHGGQCEHFCGGHDYPEWLNPIDTPWGPAAVHDYNEWVESFACHRVKYAHAHTESYCSRCDKVIVVDDTWIIDEWDEHDLDESHEWVRDIKDPCKIIDVHKVWCKLCGATITEENFIGWSHLNYGAGFNQAQPWRVNNVTLRDCCAAHEPNISGITGVDVDHAHALWCDCHGYVNRENCSNEEGRVTDDLGEYAGDLFYGTPTNVHEDMSNPGGLRQDGALHLYKHRYTYNGERLDCDLCNHYISLNEDDGNAKLIARRTDNNNVVGIGTYNFSWDIRSWINSNVRFQHFRPADEEHGNTRDIWQSWKLVIDGISGGLRELTQEGTYYSNIARERYRTDVYREYVDHYNHYSYTDKEGNTHSGSYPVYKWKWFLGEGGYPERNTIQFAVKIDKTAPKTTPTVTTGAYKTPISKLENDDGTFNSEAYGVKINLGADDSNPKAKYGKTDVAGLFAAFVEVIPVDGDGRQVTNLQKTYDLGQNRNGGVVTADQPVQWLPYNNGKGVLTINTTNVIDVNKDFPEYLDFHYKIHVMDYAGNDAVTEGDIVRQPEVFTNIQNISNNKELRKTNSFIGGEHGVLRIITTGYVDDSTLNWNEFTLGASECDRSHEYPTMVYNQILQMKPYTTETSGFRLAQKGEYYPLLEPMASYTPDGGYTRIYEFVFWTPFNHGWQNEDGSMPYKSPSDQYSVKTVGWNKRYNRTCNAKTYYKIGADKITDKFRTSLVF